MTGKAGEARFASATRQVAVCESRLYVAEQAREEVWRRQDLAAYDGLTEAVVEARAALLAAHEERVAVFEAVYGGHAEAGLISGDAATTAVCVATNTTSLTG